MSGVFQFGQFTLASGVASTFKLECDAITKEEWEGFANLARTLLPPFRVAIPVPRGGNQFAMALNQYADKQSMMILFVDDVWTTGKSMMELITTVNPHAPYHGVVLFQRGPQPAMRPLALTALFTMNERIQ